MLKLALKFREMLREMVIDAVRGAAIKPAVVEEINIMMKAEKGVTPEVEQEPRRA